MTAPDPTTGERTCDGCGKPASEVPSSDLLSTWWADYECCSMACTMRAVADDASPPAVAAAGEQKFKRQSRRSGERLANLPPGSFTMTRPLVSPASPPAVAASTGTSEDVEALAKALRDVGIERGYVGADAIRKHWAEQLLASDWLADREAAVRAEERERIAQAIEAERDLDPRTPFGLGLASAAQIAREAR